jgi:hypothetical protein
MRLVSQAGVAPVVAGITWAALVGVFVLIKPADSEATLCLFRNATGLPCPTCGSTRAVLAAADGRLVDAVTFNPLLAVVVLIGVVWLAGGRIYSANRWAPFWIGMAVLLAVNWAWVIMRQGYA